MKTVAVIEGFSGGPMHTRRFRKALAEAGFRVVKDKRRADIIIAHSAGIYGIPENVKAKLLVLVGPTYWPGQPLIKRVARHTRASRNYHVSRFGWKYYLWKKTLEVYYFFRRHKYMWLGIRNNNSLDRLNKLAGRPDRKIIIVRNQDDTFSSPKIKELIEDWPDVRFVSLPGVHDDYVTNPKPYIDLIRQAL